MIKNRRVSEKTLNHLTKVRPLAIKWHQSKEGRQWHSNHSKNRKRVEKILYCVHCGIEFSSVCSDAKYCSANCCSYHNAIGEHWIRLKTCVICDKEFFTKPSRNCLRTKTCSHVCKKMLADNTKRIKDNASLNG